MVSGANGRQPKDVVFAVRALLWLQLVHNLAPGKSDLELDELFVRSATAPRPRAFSLIGRHGIDPGDANRRGVSLVAKVGAHSGYNLSQELFDARLWQLLMPENLTRTDLGSAVLDLVEKRQVSLNLRGPFSRQTASRFESRITRLATSLNVDDLGLLVALYLLLRSANALHWAHVVGGALPTAACRYAKGLGCDDVTTAMLVALIRDRVILGHRTTLIHYKQWVHAKNGVNAELRSVGRTPRYVPRLATKAFALLAVSRYKKLATPVIGPFIEPTTINPTAKIVVGHFGLHDPASRFDLSAKDPLFIALKDRFVG